VSKRVSTSK